MGYTQGQATQKTNRDCCGIVTRDHLRSQRMIVTVASGKGGKGTHRSAHAVLDVAGEGVLAARKTKDRVHRIWKDDE